MESCREWDNGFQDWIIDLVDISLRSSVGMFEGAWYKQKIGVPTGGSLCVQLANIAVFYILHKILYSNPTLMAKILDVMRYIDDGAGFFLGTNEEYVEWINEVNLQLNPYGLFIDEHRIENPGVFVPFLDIKYCFDANGNLQTDLFIKQTDSRSYLNFRSAHPNHIYSGIVYSQCLRLRRIINSDERLHFHLSEMREAFLSAEYPAQIIDNIIDKVKNTERLLVKKTDDTPLKSSPLPIRVVSVFGADSEIVNSVKRFEPNLKETESFRDEVKEVTEAETQDKTPAKSIFQFIKKTGSSLRYRLVRNKSLALGLRFGRTRTSHHKNCECCPTIHSDDTITVQGRAK